MGQKFGLILFKTDLRTQEEELVLGLVGSAVKGGEASIADVLSQTFSDTAIGYDGNITIVADPFLPYELTSQPDFLKKVGAVDFLEDFSHRCEILCIHQHPAAGIYGHRLFSNGRTVMSCYKNGSEFTLDGSRGADVKQIRHAYGQAYLLKVIGSFLGKDADRWLRMTEIKFRIYKTA